MFAEAAADAHAGRPRVLLIDGSSGMGKTSHLRHIVAAATGFRLIEAIGDPAAYRPAYDVLAQWGVKRTTTDAGAPLSPAAAAQALRRRIDDASGDDPLLLILDDAQWADIESLAALRLVLERLTHERLLVAVASRPLPLSDRPLWQQYRAASDATFLTLDGVQLSDAFAIVREVSPVADDDPMVERLWRHTERNPMHLRSLVAEVPLEDLRAMEELPAPVQVAREVNARLAGMDEDAAMLLRAIAVVGSSWVDRFDAAAIAGIADATPPLELLLDSGLVVARPGVMLSDVRIVHALLRAAIYQSIPAAERRERHRRAATVLPTLMQRLEHEVAAAAGRDDPLAERLESAAVESSAGADHRRAAQLLMWASQLSEDRRDRERRWLEAQLAGVLGRDASSVRERIPEIEGSSDVARRTVVVARLYIEENRIAEARRLLEGLDETPLNESDEITRTRLRVLTGWTMLVSGYPTQRVKDQIASIPDASAVDETVRSLYVRTAGQVAGRENDFDHLTRDLLAVPLNVSDTPMSETSRLGWRGALHALCGFAPEARRDLSEVVARIRDGRVDRAGGVDHALYGYALWQDGEIDRANVEIEAAVEGSVEGLHPLIRAVRPLVPIVRGDYSRADRLLAESEAVLRDLPWAEALSVLLIGQVARLHAGGDVAARAAYADRVRSLFGSDALSSETAGAIWQLHVALARIWAGDLDAVDRHQAAIENDLIVPGWAPWSRLWLEGLRAERAGDLALARRSLEESAAIANEELPLYHAHSAADLARVATAVGDRVAAAGAAARAREIYARLGAHSYLDRVSPGIIIPASADPLADLSDREREVAALVLAGFSYAQIADELYVTRSTVGFHLGNIYAKTGVATRHALSQLMRDRA